MTTRRNFLKTGGLSLASLMVGQHSFARMAEKADDKLAGAACTGQTAIHIRSRRKSNRHHKDKAERPETRLDVRKLFSKHIRYDLRTQDGEW